jgi:hypothetical protein
MRRIALLPAVLAGGLLLPVSAEAEIVKLPTGEQSRLTVNPATAKALKRARVTLTASGAAKKVRRRVRAALQPLALGLRRA